MRIVTWNCNRGSHSKKLPPLIDLRPDLAIIQESPQPTSKLAAEHLWEGDNINQGLLVLGFRGWRLKRVGKPRNDPKFFIPIRVVRGNQKFNLLAAWVKPGTRYPLYRNTIKDALKIYKRFISSGPTLLVGDFNTDECWDEIPMRFGLISAYHEFFGEKLGREKHPTLYFRKNRSQKYHYDYCFIPGEWRKRIKHVEVGSYSQWASYSDHSPLVVDIRNPY